MHFSKLWNCKIPHRLHMIHPAVFFPPSQSLFCPIFLGEQLFAQTAASAIHCSREAIKKSSQCCVSVDPFLFLHVIPFSHASPLFYVRTHTHTSSFSGKHTCSWTAPSGVSETTGGGMVWRFTFFSTHKSPKLQWHGTVGFEALLRPELRGAM